MAEPLLKSKDKSHGGVSEEEREDDASCWSWVSKLWKPRPPTVAETMSMLQRTIASLALQMTHADAQ